MGLRFRHVMVLVVLLFAVSGCSSARKSVDSWLGGDESVSAASGEYAENDNNAHFRYAATIHINNYEDQRNVANRRWLGKSEMYIRGMPRDQVVIDQEVASVVTGVMKKQFSSAGYQVLDGTGGADAMFEVFGVVKQLSLNVLDRDEINIAIETTVKDAATGRVVWSGLVTEKNDRFAGVSGNSKSDVVDYLVEELKIASSKTEKAITESLKAAQPDLFQPASAVQAVSSGVTVYTAPAAVAPAAAPTAASRPVYAPTAVPVPAPAAAVPFTSTTSGLVVVTTTPPRAKVYLDEVYYGLTPLRIEMDPGVHAISVKLDGYKMVTDNLAVRRGGVTEMELNLER